MLKAMLTPTTPTATGQVGSRKSAKQAKKPTHIAVSAAFFTPKSGGGGGVDGAVEDGEIGSLMPAINTPHRPAVEYDVRSANAPRPAPTKKSGASPKNLRSPFLPHPAEIPAHL